MKTYDELFTVRGSAYDRAMQRYPMARAQEFAQAVLRAGIEPGQVVADVPAGGGYLQRYLPRGSICRGHEPCSSFTHHGAVQAATAPQALLPLPWVDASIDAAISLAGVHHLADKRPLFSELHRVLKPGGRFVLSDVAAESPVARFLDGYVGDHNSTGHEGVFLDEHTLAELHSTGWQVQAVEQVNFHWVFTDRDAMGAFCNELFDLQRAQPGVTEHTLDTELGVCDFGAQGLGLNWSLMTIVALRQ
jgi:SAM-dependent methyltransferase